MGMAIGTLRPAGIERSLGDLARRVGLVTTSTDDTLVRGLTHDSSVVQAGDLFVAVPGARTHGAESWRQAEASGAVAVLTDRAGADIARDCPLPVLVGADPRAEMGSLASWVYGEPSKRLRVIGITGTNGKTTVATLAADGMTACGVKVGLIGTMGIRAPGLEVDSVRTTPEATDLQATLAVMADSGVQAVAVEVSSHALSLGRVSGCTFEVAVFTNLGVDHLDFHGDAETYFRAKTSLFEPRSSGRAIVNQDDASGRRLLAEARLPVESYGISLDDGGHLPDWRAVDVRREGIGYRYRLVGPGVDCDSLLGLPGDYNLSNAIAAAAAAVSCGYSAECVARGIGESPGPRGRMEPVTVGCGCVVLVDYAHTPDGIRAALAVGREIAGDRGGRLWAILGAGGNRDRFKREAMGREAALMADEVVVTDDNPRWELPGAIRAEVLKGAMGGDATVREVAGRQEAITQALAAARPCDVLLLLGKGHESGQEIMGEFTPMTDRGLVEAADRAMLS